jgi:4-amino-4-deoxy-L-arabinose transferase-like glycosyltransferase
LIAGVCLVLALALRVAEVQRTAYRPINDAGSYLTLASQIARTGDYSSRRTPGSGAGGTRGPSAYFPPGFPYFLAMVDLLDGHATPRGAAIHPARLAQAALGTVTVALVGLVALEAFGPGVALIALGLAAIYPVLIELSAVLVAENLLTALVLGAVYVTLRARRSTTPYGWIAAAGLLAGLATLTHVNGIVLLPPLLVGVLTARASWSALVLRLGIWALSLVPWTLRNEHQLHRFIPVSDETGITLAGTYNGASAHNPRLPYKWRLYYGIRSDRALVRQAGHLTEPELSDRLQSQAFRYIRDHPLAPVVVAFDNSLRLLELEGAYAWKASASAVDIPEATARIGVISFWVSCLLALGGILTLAARRAPGWLWFVPILLWLSVVVVNAETPRFREPVDPFLILLAACGMASGARRAATAWHARRHRLARAEEPPPLAGPPVS